MKNQKFEFGQVFPILLVILFALLINMILISSSFSSNREEVEKLEMLIKTLQNQIIESEIEYSVLEEAYDNEVSNFVVDTIVVEIGIPVKKPKLSLPKSGVYSTDWQGGDLLHFFFIHCIEGKLYISCSEIHSNGKFDLIPLEKWFPNEIDYTSALTEIVRTRVFTYDGPEYDETTYNIHKNLPEEYEYRNEKSSVKEELFRKYK